ncbi:MAG: hypothetical protein AAGD11_16675 [Planctomycetota bacterium]
MDRWDALIIGGAAYVAVVTLVRLMAARRNHLVDQVRQQIDQQRGKPPAASTQNEDADRGAA